MRGRLVFLCCVAVLISACASSLRDFSGGPPSLASPIPSLGTLRLQLGFAEVAGESLVPGGPPDGLKSLRIRLAQADGSEPIPATDLSLAALSLGAQGSTPLTTSLSDVPLTTRLMLRIEGLDGDGERLCDVEQEIEISESGETVSVTLTPVGAVRSAAFSMLPLLELEPGVTELLRPDEAFLNQNGLLLFEGLLVYPLDPCTGWRLEINNQTLRVGSGGRVRLLVSDLQGATTGILRHPTDDGLFTEFQLSQLSQGQIVESALVLQLPFAGPCGMNGLAPGEELCSGGIPLPGPDFSPEVLAQVFVEILPPPLFTVNECNQLVPAPTQFQLKLNRGYYPEPKRFGTNNRLKLEAFTGDCEQTNGFISPGDIVRSDARESEIWYIGSTCHDFVAIGACPNENELSDAFNIPQGIVEKAAANLAKIGNFFFNTPTVEILRPAVSPADTKSCVDNHGGRYCQETLNGDVSLDFRASGKGDIVLPTTKPELVVLVKLDEEVEFVLHNNGAFGETIVGASVLDIDGELFRTFKEYPISPPVTSITFSTPKLQLSTDALLGNSPTAGTYNGYPTPGAPLKILVEEGGFGGFGGKTDTIVHSEINSAVPTNQERGGGGLRYRYFCDLAMKYKAPTTAKAGDEDRFTFTVDNCSVAVTFRLVEGGPGTSLPPGPLGFISSPVTGIEQFHQVGVTPCPQSLGSIPVSNLSDQTVTVNVSASSPLIVNPVSFVLAPGTSPTNVGVSFDCSTQNSFTQPVTITATTQSGESQQLTVPVSVEISPP